MRGILRILEFLFLECWLISLIKATAPPVLKSCTGKTSGATTGCDAASYYCIQEEGDNTIILKLIDNSESSYCTEIKEDGYYIFEITDADSDIKLLSNDDPGTTANLAIYKCDGNTCTPKYGHFKYKNKYYTISETDESEEITGSGIYAIMNDDFVECTKSETAGNPSSCATFTKKNGYFMNSDNEVYKCTSSSCLSESISEDIESCEENANSIVVVSDALKYCGDSSMDPIEFSSTPKYVTYKNVKKSSTTYPSTIVSGDDIILLKMDELSLTPVTSGNGYIIADEQNNKSILYNCSTVQNVLSCTAEDETIKGYFKVTDTTFKGLTEYIKCDGSGCEAEVTPTAAVTTIGSLSLDDSKVNLCVSSTKKVEFSSTPTNNMISINDGNIFGEANEGKFVLINISENSIIAEAASGFYIADDTTNELLSVKNTQGILYNCEDGFCTPTTSITDINNGYYKNADSTKQSIIPYIKCYKDSSVNPSVNKCISIESPSSTTTCSKTTIGQLVKDGKLCLDGTKDVSFETTASSIKYFFVNYHENSIYSPILINEEKYGVVKITSNSMTMDTSVDNAKVCMNTSTKEITILEQASDNCNSSLKPYIHCNGGLCYNDCNASTGSDCLGDRYYLFSDANGTTAETTLPTNSGYLFYCETAETECSNVSKVGYYKNINPISSTSTYDYIKCAVDDEAEGAIKCEYLTAETSCSAVGDIIKETDSISGEIIFSLCLDTTGPIKADLSQTGKYFIDITAGTTVFGTYEGFVIVNFDGKNAILSSPETDVEIYRYCSKATQKLIDFSSDTDNSEYCGTGKNPLTTNTIEFSLVPPEENDSTNYYVKEEYPS